MGKKISARELPAAIAGVLDECRNVCRGRDRKDPLAVAFDRFTGALTVWMHRHENAATRLAEDGPAFVAALRIERQNGLANRLNTALESLN